MKLTVLVSLLFLAMPCFSQTGDFKCPCSKIGIDTNWADSNKVSCYRIPVSRDVNKKTAGKFYLAVVKVAAARPTKEQPVLYLHGGPGIATLENVPRYLKSKTWNLIRQERPIIFFDYRGTGFSEPTLCPGVQDSMAAAMSKNLPPEELDTYKIALFRKCRELHATEGIDISTFNTFQLAEDAESIRKSLGIAKWNVYGVSHGTTVALNLLRNHSDRIESTILDSPFPPNAPWPDFVRPFATSFKLLEEKIEADSNMMSIFPHLRSDFTNVVSRLNTTPVAIPKGSTGATYPFSGNDFAWSIWSAMLKPAAIPFVPLIIKEVANGNDSILSKWAAAFRDPNAFGNFSDFQSKAVLCYEGKPKNEDDRKAALLKKYPEFASFNLDFEDELCNAWQPKSAGMEAFDAVSSKVPVLILSGEYDPVCPPFFGELTSKTLSRSTFITVPAASHAAVHADDCIRNIALDFLRTPSKKVAVACVSSRPQIAFVTKDLQQALSVVTKN